MRVVANRGHQGFWGIELEDAQVIPSWEHPGRADLVDAALAERGFDADDPPPIDRSLLDAVHDPDYLAFVEGAWDRWIADGRSPAGAIGVSHGMRRGSNRRPEDLDGQLGYYAFAADCGISAETWSASLGAASAAAEAARLVASGEPAAFARSRPPGHHAGRDYFGGYCYLNNSAIAATVLRAAGADTVGIVDVDYHHGNGTQDIFYDRADVVTVSLHADPAHQFPWFAGYADETGTGLGLGSNLNLPLPRGCRTDEWFDALEVGLTTVAHADALVVPLGVDTFIGDPISDFRLDSEDFFAVGERIKRRWSGPVVFVMEGGYAPRNDSGTADEPAMLGTHVVNVLEGYGRHGS